MRERDIEEYLKVCVEQHGGEIRKLKWVGRRGAPDRLVMLNGPHFVELKAPGERPDPHQAREWKRMVDRGLNLYLLDSYTAVDTFLHRITELSY